MFCELFFYARFVLKDKNNSSNFMNRNSFFWDGLLLDRKSFGLPKNSNLIRCCGCGVLHSVSSAAKAILLFESWRSSQGPRVYDD